MQPVNMDFAIVSVGVGAEWRIGASLSLAADYTHFFVLSRDVQTSIYQEGPNVAEGFDLPPGNGRYSATADRIGLALRWQL